LAVRRPIRRSALFRLRLGQREAVVVVAVLAHSHRHLVTNKDFLARQVAVGQQTTTKLVLPLLTVVAVAVVAVPVLTSTSPILVAVEGLRAVAQVAEVPPITGLRSLNIQGHLAEQEQPIQVVVAVLAVAQAQAEFHRVAVLLVALGQSLFVFQTHSSRCKHGTLRRTRRTEHSCPCRSDF